MPGVTSWRYAPIEAITSALIEVILPSFVAASSSVVTKSRPWIVASAFSERSSIHFTGRAQPPGERDGEQLLGVDVELRAEAATDIGGDHAQLRLGHPERGGGEQPQDVRDLRRRPQRHVAAGLRPGDDAARLDRVRDQRRLHVAVLDDHIGAVVERRPSRASRRSETFVPSSSCTSAAPSCAAAATSTSASSGS